MENNNDNSRINKKASSNASSIEGVITVSKRGIGYVSNEAFEEDIEIPNDYINTALNRDIVEIILHPKVEGERLQGEVIKIIKRAKIRFVGAIERQNGLLFLAPDDQRMYMDILLPLNEEIKEGMKVLAEITHWNDPKRILKVVSFKYLEKGEHNTEMQSIVLEHGFETKFSSDVEKVAKEIENRKTEILKEEEAKRRDFREIITFTIDPPDAKDFDDALSVKNLDNGNIEIGVHIADVSYYVTPGSPIDKEAQKRATSIYLVDRTIPMLPEVISNDVSSLNPNENKLTYSAVFEITKKGEIKNHWFGETIINSNKRFTYEEAQKTLDAESGEYYKELKILNDLAKILREKRFENGSIEFEHSEIKFELDENGKPISIKRKQMFDTNHLIEEYMLLANKEVAEYIFKLNKKIYYLYIAFTMFPTPKRYKRLKSFLKRLVMI